MSSGLALIAGREAADADLAIVGGKGKQLGMLQRFGLPVPDFFVIPAAWSRQRAGWLPADLLAELQHELIVRGWENRPLAVRSSAADEDSVGASYAGIYRSHLNVQGFQALERAVIDVWASLDTSTAAAYRQRLGLDGEPAMAVIVMPLLAAEASGIAFTCDPVSGREDRMIVHANWGLGESLVGGEAAGDEYVFAEDATDTWRLRQTKIGSKAVGSFPAAGGGTAQRPLTAGQSAAPVLDGTLAEALAALVRDAAVAFDFVAPFYDVEWVWDGRGFWLTQARPVTRRPHYTYAGLHRQPAIWTRGNTCEIMPEPLQPMDWNFARRGCNDLLEQGWKLSGYPVLPGVQRAALLDGRLYLEASVMQWEAWDAMGLLPERFNALMGGHQPTIAVSPPGWRDRLRRAGHMLRYMLRAPAMARRGDAEVAAARALARELRDTPLPESTAEIVERLQRLLRPAREFHGMFFLQGSGGGSLSLLLDTLARVFPGEAEAIGAALLAGGEPSVTATQGYALLDLAQRAKRARDPARPLDDPEFATAFAAFLDEYGHRGHYETYVRSARWHEEPERLLEQLPALAGVDATAMRARQQALAGDAWARIRRELPFWHRPVLRAQVRAANRDCNRREAARSAIIALLSAGRRLWLLIADRLVAEGVLDRRDDIFLLMPSEVLRYAGGLLPAAGLRARVAVRAAQFSAWQTMMPKEWLTLMPEGVAAASPTPAAQATPEALPLDGRPFRGVATGTGIARGRVRRLRHPAEGNALLPGEILVAPSTDPGWTPLFLKAGGLVVETGGYMSHGAIVAREFALPAVVNLPGILDVLQDGDEVEVDGLCGEVRKLQPGRLRHLEPRQFAQ
jgi:rifampicin phosphotransferase